MKTAGPGRQVQDASYFVSLLRSKCTSISKEVRLLRKEIQQTKNDGDSYVKYERKYEEHMGDVRRLEGKLADYNLAMDKARAGTDPMTVEEYREELRDRNAREAQHVDSIFPREAAER